MIFIGMNHPKHFWMFKEFIKELESRNISFLVFVSSKDVLLDLLDENNTSYILLGSNKKGILNKVLQLFTYVIKVINYSFKYKPSLYLGQALPHFAFASFFFPKSNFIILEDTEHVTTLHKVVVPFCSTIYTPRRFPNKFGKKQKVINTIYELLYLHPKYFKSDNNVLLRNNISIDVRYAIVRIVSWNAHHDINKTGLSIEFVDEIIEILNQFNIKTYITTEKPLPKRFDDYVLKINKLDIHQVLYYADVYIGEGATMAAEAAIIGTPSIYINEMNTSFCKELADDYNLMDNFRDTEGVIDILSKSLADPTWKTKQKRNLDVLLNQMEDPLAIIVKDLLN